MAETLFVVAFAAAVLSGVMGGIFYAFSSAVMPAFGRISAPNGITAMQAINVAVINPVFMLAFLGPAFLSALLLVATILGMGDLRTGWTVTGSLLYLVGCIAITGAFNIPRNNALERVSPESHDGATYWSRYLAEWTAWNHVRTVACLAAMACFILALR